MVSYDADLISGLLLCMLRSQNRQGRLYYHFSRWWITNLVTHRKRIHTTIILNEDAEALNQPVYIETNGSDCLCTDTWWQKNMHISCAITRDVLCTFLACVRLAINVSCYGRILSSVDNLCKQFGPRSVRLDKSRAWSGFELFDIHSYMVSEQTIGAGSKTIWHSDCIPQKLLEWSLF